MLMKSLVAINTVLPTIDNNLSYFSGASLRDYDIAVVDPKFPYLERVNFSGGCSCLDIESTRTLTTALHHWQEEIKSALHAGKTIFFLLNEFEKDLAAISCTTQNKSRNYSTSEINNYQLLPVILPVKNTKGSRIKSIDKRYEPLLTSISDLAGYRVIFEKVVGHPIYAANDGTTVGLVMQLPDTPGHLVLLPYFNLADYAKRGRERSTARLEQLTHTVVEQLFAIDKFIRQRSSETPAPEWVASVQQPKQLEDVDAEIASIDAKIAKLREKKEKEFEKKERLLSFSRLLYENGKALESAIEDALRELGFTVSNQRVGDFEIDHIIVGTTGKRLIGETEGKDNSAIDISKFRQLESNINEDFQREDVDEPAKGVLFGNGYRFTKPSERPEQFTAKCLTNAKRLQTALVKTCDLYDAVVCVLNNPDDESFRSACREAIECTIGEIVVFPKIAKSVKEAAAD